MFPGSGTGAWEAAITNTLNPGDRVLMARTGQFSKLWAEMAGRLGLEVEVIDVAWGAGAPVTEFGRRLADDVEGKIKAVFVTHNETATGVTSDVAAVRAVMDAAYHDALLFVDGVSLDRLDRLPHGRLEGRSRGHRQPEGADAARRPRHPRGQREGAGGLARTRRCRAPISASRTCWRSTPTATFPTPRRRSCCTACAASLDRLFAEGLDNVFARHRRLAEGVRRGVAGLGAATLVAEHPLARLRHGHGDPGAGRGGRARRDPHRLRHLQHLLRHAGSARSPARCSASATWAI